MEKETKINMIELSIAYFGVLVMSILMATGVVSGMYSGESITFETNLTNPVYTVIGNGSSLDGLNVNFENGNITISSDPLMASDNFTLIFYDEVTRDVIRTIHTGGGGSKSTKYVDRNVTTYVPIYINDTEIIVEEVEVDNGITSVGQIPIWEILLPLVIFVSIILMFMLGRKTKKSDSAEKLVEESGDARYS